MNLRPVAVGALVVLGLAANERAVATRGHAAEPLPALFIVLHVWSDNLSASYDELLDLTAVGKDVRVRIIRLSLANPYCRAPLVRAVERVVPGTTVEKLAGSRPCETTPADLEAALAAAPPSVARAVFETASQTMVAACGREQRVLEFPWPERVDRQKLARDAPEVDALWRTYGRVQDRAFGKNFRMSDGPPARQKALEDLGDALVPDIVSGKYQAAFDGWKCSGEPGDDCHGRYLAWRLRGYRGAPANRDLLAPELIEAASLRFAKYTAPVFPPIALTAHVHGDVRLHLVADSQTGVVKTVDVVSGNGILSAAATKAASTWQFEPGSLAAAAIDVTLRFEIRCPQ